MKLKDVAQPRRLSRLSRDRRGYPIIATVERDEKEVDFGSVSERRKLALGTFDWCAVCGLPFNEEARWQVVPDVGVSKEDLDNGIGFSEAPVHEICAIYAAHVCPHLSSPGHRMGDEYRVGQKRSPKIRLAGFKNTVDIQPLESQLQRGTYILHFVQSGYVGEFSYSEPEELSERYAVLLEAERDLDIPPSEARLIELFNEVSDMGATVTGAALMAGACFAKDIRLVQGMGVYEKSGFWRGLAMHFMDKENLKQWHDAPDEATAAISKWLIEREKLPLVLGRWRDIGQRKARSKGRISARGAQLEGVGRTVSKNDPCPCGSGRKARRCHPAGIASSAS